MHNLTGCLAGVIEKVDISSRNLAAPRQQLLADAAKQMTGIVAMMCCDDADRRCPVVPGCDLRVPLHYRDPKESDGTDRESRTYDERSMQIAAEMFFLIRSIRENLNPG